MPHSNTEPILNAIMDLHESAICCQSKSANLKRQRKGYLGVMRVSSQVTARFLHWQPPFFRRQHRRWEPIPTYRPIWCPAPPWRTRASTRTCWIVGHRDQYLEPVLDIEPSFRNGNCVQRFGRQIVTVVKIPPDPPRPPARSGDRQGRFRIP